MHTNSSSSPPGRASSGGNDRRVCPRHPWSREVRLQPLPAAGLEARWALARDISRTGIRLLLGSPPRHGERVAVELPGRRGGPPRRARARLIRGHVGPDGNSDLGYAFEPPLPEQALRTLLGDPAAY